MRTEPLNPGFGERVLDEIFLYHVFDVGGENDP